MDQVGSLHAPFSREHTLEVLIWPRVQITSSPCARSGGTRLAGAEMGRGEIVLTNLPHGLEISPTSRPSKLWRNCCSQSAPKRRDDLSSPRDVGPLFASAGFD